MNKYKIAVYEEALKTIAELDGPLVGEDALCFRKWAQEALGACASQPSLKGKQGEKPPTVIVDEFPEWGNAEEQMEEEDEQTDSRASKDDEKPDGRDNL